MKNIDTTRHLASGSVGIVETQYFTFAATEPLKLVSGKTLGPVTLAYETYGKLNAKKNNAVLLDHALSGNAHAAGYYTPEDPYPGWWDIFVGPGKPFDTDKYFIICSNVIGSCAGSTGPASVNPLTGKPYGSSFPVITVRDMVEAQRHLIDHLGIEKLLAVAGGSMGAMQALEWAINYPERVFAAIPLAVSHCQSALGIAFNEVARQAIFQDANWNNGDYYDGRIPQSGLALARMIGHITYLSEQKMHEKFGRRLQATEDLSFGFQEEFQIESYLHHQGIKFVGRFDANSYLYLTKALDYFDLKADYGNGSLSAAFESTRSDFLMVSFSSDWLYPSAGMREMVNALRSNGRNGIYIDIDTDDGHDAFLLPDDTLADTISNFLRREQEKFDGNE
ncbi:MAG: homoserine O-acetyltransferase MetX [Spirochaetota bacterium]